MKIIISNMDYDIDIEEHDVLDNPCIRRVFPDIAVIKKEITQYFEEPSIKIEPEVAETPVDVQSRLNLNNSNAAKYHPSSVHKQTPPVQSNKIILGSKPNADRQNENRKHILDSKLDCYAVDDTGEQVLDTLTHTKKLILGSKPNSDTRDEHEKKLILGSEPNGVIQNNVRKVDTKKLSVMAKLKQMKVILQDIKSYLNKNGRYCKVCCRLFLSKKALIDHKNKEHHKKIIKNNMEINNVTETRHKCGICGSYLSSNGNLHRHYRNIHHKRIKLRRSNAKSKMPSIKTDSHNKINELKTKTEKKQNKLKMHSNHNMCNICSIEFVSFKSLERHLRTHKIKNDTNKNYDIIDEKVSQPTSSEESIKTVLETKKRKIDSKSNADIFVKVNPTQQTAGEKNCKITSVEKNHDSNYITRAGNSTSKDSNLCLHCKKAFPDQKSLIEHMYEILEPKRKSSETVKSSETHATSDKSEDDKLLFVCRQCSYYLPSFNAYYAHMTRNHKTVKFLDTKKEYYDPQCKYCSYSSSSITTHNKHISSYHIDLMFMRIENEIENDKKGQSHMNENIDNNAIKELNFFALESVLFECTKCRICFMSSIIASNHNQHTKMMNNWKCSICHHVLKEQFKEIHLKQHTFSQTVKVLNLNEQALSNILYNCTKCAIHFTEKRYQEHYSNCGSDATDSFYCMVCDILVDKAVMSEHKTQHKHLTDITDFTIIDSNLIVDTVLNLKRKGADMVSEVRPRKRLYEQHNCFTYCPTCKSFLSNVGLKNKNHIKGICSHILKYACDECGLIFTSSTLQIHKERHGTEKNLRLQDFKFFDLQGNLIHPPIPQYPHCKICKIHFLRNKAISRHICDETDYLTCDICNIKLAEKTFKLHMSFHFYMIQKKSFANDLCSTPNKTLPDKATKTLASFNSKNISEIESKSEQKLPRTAKTDPEENLLRKTGSLPETTLDKFVESNEKVAQKSNCTDLVEEQISNADSLVVLYTCKTCGVSVESYDDVIKHCRTHYNANQNENQIPSVMKCKQCSLKFDSNSYLGHHLRVHSNVSKIQVLKFDPSYFTSKNMIWMKHIFQTLPDEMVKKLLETSIYQHEHRIQFECIQKGSSLLHVYKCDLCENFIDPSSVYKHAENPCSKVRKHPCSLCGLPFISVFSRTSHEKLHKQLKRRLTKKSFNIVLFNQSKDKAFNDRIFCTTNQYLLYQCRNCDRVVEKLMLEDHVCDRNSLVKCLSCGMLIGKEDFKAHLSKHTDLGNFYSDNFKVILFGCKTNTSNVLKTLTPCFSGTVYDYTLYKCEICQMCLKNWKSTDQHTCIPNFDLDRSMCSECNLYFPSGNLKHHTKQHGIDPDFTRENMNIVLFNRNLTQNNNENDEDNKDSDTDDIVFETRCNVEHDTESRGDISTKLDVAMEKSDYNREKRVDGINKITNHENENLEDNIDLDDGVYDMDDKELETLYKCNCGLHFLNKFKATEHLKDCQPKMKHKQTCSKCHLLFTANELFAHLVVHHKNKSLEQQFKVIEISLDYQNNAKDSITVKINDSVR